ncbi:hypothetical protein GCM10023082_52430 [Streptomyces tremellae]|uniref:Uncharacterized protein n=2 Tax=Streptomyces tremellae TaxID=1124239 RepID=A0ABP7FZM0_9ACTN
MVFSGLDGRRLADPLDEDAAEGPMLAAAQSQSDVTKIAARLGRFVRSSPFLHGLAEH